MYAYEVHCEDEYIKYFYPTVNKFVGRDNKDVLLLCCLCANGRSEVGLVDDGLVAACRYKPSKSI